MDPLGDRDFDEVVREITEVGIGSLILGLRQLNIARRDLVERVPAAEPAINAVLEQVELIAEPMSAAVGALVAAVGDSVGGSSGEQMSALGATLAEAGPELLRLSGLTRPT